MSHYSIKPENGKLFIDLPGVTTILDPIGFGSIAAAYWATELYEQKIYTELNKVVKPGIYIEHDIVRNVIYNARFTYKDESKKALDIGSQVHKFIKKYIKNGQINLAGCCKEVRNAFKAFLKWKKDNDIEFIESEKTIFLIDKQDGLAYAGTLDTLAMLNGVIYIVDFKSNKKFYPNSMVPQLSAYLYARQKLNNEIALIKKKNCNNYQESYKFHNIQGMGILRLDKETGLPEWKDYSNLYERGLECFKHLCRYFYAAKTRRLKNNPCVR